MGGACRSVGTRLLTPEQVSRFEQDISSRLDRQINVDIWYRSDTVITDKGFMPFQKLNEQNVEELDKYLMEHNKKPQNNQNLSEIP